jgi:hypothetical protein
LRRTWLRTLAVCTVACVLGMAVGRFGTKRTFEATTAQYVTYGFLSDIARLEYQNGPASRALVVVDELVRWLNDCKRSPTAQVPCEGVVSIQARLMLATLHKEVGDVSASEREIAALQRECVAREGSKCSATLLDRILGTELRRPAGLSHQDGGR